MFQNNVKLAAWMGIVVACMAASASARAIDNFDVGSPVNYIGPSFSGQTGLGASTLSGGRHTQLTTAGTSVEVNSPDAPLDSTGLLAFSNDDGVAGSLLLSYNTFLGVDLTNGGLHNAVIFDFQTATRGLDITFKLYHGALFEEVIVNKNIAAGAQIVGFLFSEFAGLVASNVVAAQVILTPLTPGGDYILGAIESADFVPSPPAPAVPTPAALPAGLILLAGLVFARRVR